MPLFMGMNMHELGMNKGFNPIYVTAHEQGYSHAHEVTMIVGIKSMKYGPKFPNFIGVARENLLCFEREHGHVHAKEP